MENYRNCFLKNCGGGRINIVVVPISVVTARGTVCDDILPGVVIKSGGSPRGCGLNENFCERTYSILDTFFDNHRL